ncbi:MAG: nucleotide exchange factor GrpE [Nitrospinae bacterium]|nr:nucleotide exchange factor GrpE [Nitrospinota bacterium]
MTEKGKITDHTDEALKVFDKRHWVNPEARSERDEKGASAAPTYVAKLEEQAAQSEAKLKEYIAAYKAKLAENDQWRARMEKDVDKRARARAAELVGRVMPGVDHLSLAVESAQKTGDVEALIQGILMIKSGFSRIFAELGLTEIECLGRPFNPELMEAVQVARVHEKEKDDLVLEIAQAGYLMDDVLVRPAKVVVGRYGE